MRIFLTSIFFLLINSTSFAQALENMIPQIEQRPRQITDTLGRDYDTRPIDVADLPDDLADQYTGDAFNYEETTKEASNFLSDFFDWLFKQLGRWFGIDISPFWASVLEYTVYAVFAAIAIYLIVRMLTGAKADSVLSKKTQHRNLVNLEEKDIQEIDLSVYIKESIEKGNYRKAVRYMYLNALKQLSAVGAIDWDFQKTNADYYREIKDQEVRTQFQKVSYLYDYIWYGEFFIDEHAFAKAQLEFDTLNKKLV